MLKLLTEVATSEIDTGHVRWVHICERRENKWPTEPTRALCGEMVGGDWHEGPLAGERECPDCIRINGGPC